MIGTLIVTQGNLGREMLATARTIAGDTTAFEAVALGWDERPEDGRVRVEAAIARVDRGEGVLILTDMYGSTPSNLALSLRQPGQVEVLTGVNLPMVVRLACLGNRERSLADLASWLKAKGQESIRVASEPPAPGCAPAAAVETSGP